MPKVSVIIPSYNHEEFITEAIRSVLSQTYQDFEIIIVDDASRDLSVDRIKKIKDTRINLICFNKNQGASAAMNRCIEEAKGEYIAVLNSDDVFENDKLELQVNFLDEHPEFGAVFGYAKIIDDDGNDFTGSTHFYYDIFQQPNRTRHEWLNYFFYKGNCICHPSVLIRRECYDNIGYYNECFAQLPDFDFWVRLCMQYEIHIIPEKLIRFRIRQGEENASGNKPEAAIRISWELTQILKHYLSINSVNEFHKIFPSFKGKTEEKLIPFYVANLALEVKSAIYRQFAINTIYEILGDCSLSHELNVKHGFRYIDFIRMTGKHDLFSFCLEWNTHLFIDTGEGFNENQCITETSNLIPTPKATIFTLKFNISNFPEIKSLRWDPIENKLCRVEVSSILFIDKFGQEQYVDISKVTSNGSVLAPKVFSFDTPDPMFFIPVEGKANCLIIKGQIEYKDFGPELTNKLGQLEEILNSRFWKILAPFRWFDKLW